MLDCQIQEEGEKMDQNVVTKSNEGEERSTYLEGNQTRNRHSFFVILFS